MRSKGVALGGVTAALAVVIMCMGGLIPLATFVCPVICMILLQLLQKPLSNRNCWVWYVTVSILALLLSPDKESAFVLVFLGYYPIVRNRFPQKVVGAFVKVFYFNVSILLMYLIMILLFGMTAILTEFQDFGVVMGAVTLLLGNMTFLVLDRLLTIFQKKF